MGFSQRKHYIAFQHPDLVKPEILEKYIGAEIKGDQKNTQAALLEEFFSEQCPETINKGTLSSI